MQLLAFLVFCVNFPWLPSSAGFLKDSSQSHKMLSKQQLHRGTPGQGHKHKTPVLGGS